MHWRGSQLDAVQPTSAEYQQVLWCATARRQHQLSRCPFRIGPDTIIPLTAVWDLGIYIDSDLSMKTHVQWSVAGCFAVLRQLRSIRRVVPSSVYQSLVVALVLSRLDYGNATLAGLLACLLNRLQSVLNTAARSIAGLRRSEHITDALASFHWLWAAPERIKFKLSVIVYPSSSWHCTSVPVGSAAVRRRSADETLRSPALVNFQSSWSPPVTMCHCRQSLICHCRPTTLEQSTWWFPVCPVRLQLFAENSFISAVIPRHCSVA